MSSLAEEVKALIAMGIPPTKALEAVTAERERRGLGDDRLDSSPVKTESTSKRMGNDYQSPSPPKRGGRPGLASPLSYNRPGVIKHTHVVHAEEGSDNDPLSRDEDDLFPWLRSSCGFTESEASKICNSLSAEDIQSKKSMIETVKSDKTYFISGKSLVDIRSGKHITAVLHEENLVYAPTRSTVSHPGDSPITPLRNRSPYRNSSPNVSSPMDGFSSTMSKNNMGGDDRRDRSSKSPKDRSSPAREKRRPLALNIAIDNLRQEPSSGRGSSPRSSPRGSRPSSLGRESTSPKDGFSGERSRSRRRSSSRSRDGERKRDKSRDGRYSRSSSLSIHEDSSPPAMEKRRSSKYEDFEEFEDHLGATTNPNSEINLQDLTVVLDSKKFINKSDSHGLLESQRPLSADFSSETSFLPVSLLSLQDMRKFWRLNFPAKDEDVDIESFLQSMKVYLIQEKNIHKSEAKLCVSSLHNVLDSLDLNRNKRVSVLQLRLLTKSFGVRMSLFDAFLKLRERDHGSLLFIVPALPSRYIPLRTSVDGDIANALSQTGFTRVIGPAHSGKTTRVLSACHNLPVDIDCVWLDFRTEITSEAGAISQLAAELGFSGVDSATVLHLFRKLLSKLSTNSIVVFDQIDSHPCAEACSVIFKICSEHSLSFVIISRSSGDSMPIISQVDGKANRNIHIGALSLKEASQMASIVTETDSHLLAECAECLPGNILALGTLSSTYFKQLASVSKKNPDSISNAATEILMKSFDEYQKTCAHCLAPLLHLNAYVSEECLWYLCEEAFKGNKTQWSDAVNGLERMGWLRASLTSEDFLVIGDRLPPKDNAPSLFKQCARYCDFWAKQINLIHDAFEAGLTATSLFLFDRYRSHFIRLLSCWGAPGENAICNTSLASFGLLGSNYARDVAISIAGKVAAFCSVRMAPPECVDICCDIFTIIEHNEKRSVEYILASLDLARMLLLNSQLFDSLELSTEMIEGIKDVLPDTHSQFHFFMGSGLSVLAQVYDGLGQKDNAITTYNKSVDSLGVYYGMESRQYAVAEHSLGHVHRAINSFHKAELCYKKALECFKTCHGNGVDNEDVACVMNDLAGIFKSQNEGEKAYEYYIEVFRIRNKVLGSEHIESANSLNNLAVLLHANGKYDEAKKYYQDALVIYKELLGDFDPDVAASLNNLGALHDDLGDFEEAKSYYESSLVIRKTVLNEDHPDLAASLGNLAALLDDNGDIVAAKDLYLQTLKITRQIYGNSHIDVASTLVNIAALEDEQGNLSGAKKLYEEALSIFVELFTEENADVASTMTCLANVAKMQHDHQAVRYYYGRVIDIYQALCGNDSVEVANAMTSYGVYLFKNGTTNMGGDGMTTLNHDDPPPASLSPAHDDDDEVKRSTSVTVLLYEESSQLLEEALHIRRGIMGPYHADIVASLKNIGWLRKVQRHFPQAVESYEEALKICEKMYNRNHPEVAECLTQLGVLNKLQNKFKDAISFFEEAIRIYKNVAYEDRKNKKKYMLLIAANFSSLAIVHKSMRNYENAVECYKECFEIQYKELGNDNIEVAKTLHALGLVTWYLGNEQTARKLLEEALDIRRRILPDRHPDIIQSLNNLADMLGEDHKYNESMRKYADAVSRIEETVGTFHPDLTVDLLNMALLAFEMGKYNEAIPLFERGLSIRIKAYGDDHELVAEYLLAIANLHVAQRQFREAKFEFEGGLAIIDKKVGKESREYAVGLGQFGKCLQLMCEFKEAIPVVNEALVIFRSAALSSDEGLTEEQKNKRMLDLSNILIIGADVYVGCGDYAAAEPFYEEAIEILQKVLGDDNIEVATILMKLAGVLKNQQYYSDAKHVYQEALQIRRQCLGLHIDVVQVLNHLGDLCKRLGELDGALMYYEESLVIRERLLGEYHPDVAQGVHAVAAVYDLKGDFEEAERLFQRALLLRRKSLGNKHPDVAQTLNNLAAILDDLNRSGEAEVFYREALDIYKEVYGDQHPDVALSLNNLAALLDDGGDFESALKLYEEALVITKKIYGAGSLDVASAQLCLACAMQHLKRYSEAEKLFQLSVSIKSSLLGENHLDVATTKIMFAELFVEEKEIVDAKELLLEALSIRETILGSDHPDVLSLRDRVNVLDREVTKLIETNGEVTSADGSKRLSITTIHSMETAVKRKQEELGPDNVAVADLLVQLANSLISKDRYHDALEKLQEALRIFKTNYSPDNNLVIITMDKVVAVLSHINECEQALPLLIEVIEMKAKVYGEVNESLAESLTELGSIYDRLDKLEESSDVYKKALAIKRVTVGNESVEVGHALNNLGAILDDLGNHEEAEPYYREGLEIFKKIYGPDHPDVALSLNNLAALLDDRGEFGQAKVFYEEALGITKRVFGSDSIEVSAALICVARTMKSLLQFEAAANYYDAAAQIKEAVLGPITSDVALLYDQVGSMYVKLKWYEEGVNVYGKSYSIRKQLYGESHPELALSLELISALHEEWNHPSEAASLLEEALEIRIAHHGGRVSTDIADILVKLAALARKNRKPRNALPYLNEALATYRSCYGSKHAVVASTLCSIASIYKGFHKFNEAININRKAMLIREVVEGEKSLGVAEIIMSLGAIKEKQKLYDEAQSHYEDALSMYTELHNNGPHADIAQTMTSLALVHKLQKNYNIAKDFYDQALDMRKQLYPTAHPDIAQSMNNLAALLYSMHEYTDAKVLYEDSLEMLIELLGNENLDVAQAMNNLAALLFAKKNHKEAEPLYEESLRIRRRLLGSDHLDVASSLCNLGILKRSLRAYDESIQYFEESLTIRMKILNDDQHHDIKVCKKHLAFLKQLSVPLKVGMRVEVNDRSIGKVLQGEVVRVHRNDMFDVKYDIVSMGIATHVARSRITALVSIASMANLSNSPPLNGETVTTAQTPESIKSVKSKETFESADSDKAQDRVSEDFLKAGMKNKILRNSKSSGSAGKSTGSSEYSSPSEKRAPNNRLKTSDVSIESAASDSSTDSSNSGSALNQILEQSRLEEKPVTGSSTPNSPGYTILKSRSSVGADENLGASSGGIVRHISFNHKSPSVVSEGSDEAEVRRSRYKESVGGASGFRRSYKSLHRKESAASELS